MGDQQVSPEFISLVLEEARRNEEKISKGFDAVHARAGMTIGFCGLVIPQIAVEDSALTTVKAVLFAGAIAFALWAYLPSRRDTGVATGKLWIESFKDPLDVAKARVINAQIEANAANTERLAKAAKRVRWAIVLVSGVFGLELAKHVMRIAWHSAYLQLSFW